MRTSIVLLSLFLLPVFVNADAMRLRSDMPAVCKTGDIPPKYRGKYVVGPAGNQAEVFVAKDHVLLRNQGNDTTAEARSCVVQGIRVVTLSDPKGSFVFNLTCFASFDSKQLLMTELREVPQKNTPDTIQEIIMRSVQFKPFTFVLQGLR